MAAELCLVAVVAAMAGIGLGAAKWRGSAESFHREARVRAIIDQAGQMPPNGIVVIGDSITEFNRFDRLCGRPALNAGVAWSTTADWLPDARGVIAAARPSIVVLALGTNDTDSPAWRDRFRDLARETRAAFAVRPRNAGIAGYISTVLPTVGPPLSYRDGTHPDATGAAQWRAGIERGCARLGRSPRPILPG